VEGGREKKMGQSKILSPGGNMRMNSSWTELRPRNQRADGQKSSIDGQKRKKQPGVRWADDEGGGRETRRGPRLYELVSPVISSVWWCLLVVFASMLMGPLG